MRTKEGSGPAKEKGMAKRGKRLITTVSSHMVNYPAAMQAGRPLRRPQSLLGACTACRARSAA